MGLKELFPGVYSIGGRLATRNLTRGTRVYGEKLVIVDGSEYRSWNPYRSKLAAALLNGLKNFRVSNGSKLLYIGAATGTTASHVSDIVGEEGVVYCVEMSERNMRELIKVCEARRNMLPILADARHVDRYSEAVGRCDLIYQDASAREQAAMLVANSALLKKGGYAYFVIKSQSVDISKEPREVFRKELEGLSGSFELVEKVALEPYDRMHLFAVLRKR